MRLDRYLYEHGYCRSRSLGGKMIREGYVLVDGTPCLKPSTPVFEENEIRIRENPLDRYVSRGGLKLEEALEAFGVDPTGLVCVDLGASTGGFTDCLLQHGAREVYAVDSGSDQLHPSLKNNPLVHSMERVNARFLDEGDLPPCDLAVMDVSFISQSLLYPAVSKILRDGSAFLSLVKPQFEVGREHVGSGGIVRSEKATREAIEALREKAKKCHLHLIDLIPSPILGGDGNREYLAYFRLSLKGDDDETDQSVSQPAP